MYNQVSTTMVIALFFLEVAYAQAVVWSRWIHWAMNTPFLFLSMAGDGLVVVALWPSRLRRPE